MLDLVLTQQIEYMSTERPVECRRGQALVSRDRARLGAAPEAVSHLTTTAISCSRIERGRRIESAILTFRPAGDADRPLQAAGSHWLIFDHFQTRLTARQQPDLDSATACRGLFV